MNIEERLCALERQSKRWRLICGLQAVFTLLLLGLLALRPTIAVHATDDVLRAKGLIITDSGGKARIMLGVPLPETKDRIRRDAGYAAMVFLDEKGHDRLSLGQELPAQIDGVISSDRHRISPGYGFMINDPKGNERGGFGFLDNGRAVLALDRPNGDAWAAMVDDNNGFAGTLSIYDRSIGENVTGIFSGTQGKRAFVDLKDFADRPREQLQIGIDGRPAINILDENGKLTQNLIVNSH